ncbi:MAG: amino acid ABC transporter permease [Cellulomonadaceae bacterium]
MKIRTSVLFDAPGPRARRNVVVVNILALLAVLGIAAWVLLALNERGQLTAAKWEPLLRSNVWTAYLLPGLWNTLRAALFATIGSLIFGLIFGVGRLSLVRPIRWLSSIVVEFFRAVPVLILMIFFWYFLSFNGIVPGGQSPFYAVVIGLTLYNGSVIAELVRSGVSNLPSGQREAASSIGLTRGQSLRIVELPQALLAMMPSMVSQLVVILKDTALGYIVTYPELLRQTRLVGTANGNLIPALIVSALLFILVNYALTKVAELLGERLSARTPSPTKVEAPATVEEPE